MSFSRRMVRRKKTWRKPESMDLFTIDHGPGQPVETFKARNYEEVAYELISRLRLQVDDSDGPWKIAARNEVGDEMRVEGRNEPTGIGGEFVLTFDCWFLI